MLLLSIAVTTIVCLPVLRGFLQTPNGDELTYLAQHHEALSLSKGFAVWWPTLADGPQSHVYPLASVASALLFALHRVLSQALETSAGTAIGLFNFLLFSSGAGVFATALTRSLHTRPSARHHLQLAVATSIAVLALFTTGNTGGWNSFTTGAISGWFPAFIALAFVLRLTGPSPSSTMQWAFASVIVGALYGPAVIVLVVGLLAHRWAKPIHQARSTTGKDIVLFLAASAGLLADVAWTVIYRNMFGGRYEGVTPVDITQLPQSLIGSISSNLNGVDSLRFALLAQVGSWDVFVAILASLALLLLWRVIPERERKAPKEQHLQVPPSPAPLLLRTSALLVIGAGVPYVASAKYANTTFSPPTSQYFNSVFLMAALIGSLAILIAQAPVSALPRWSVLAAIGTLIAISSTNLSVRADAYSAEVLGVEALDQLVSEHESLSCVELAPMFLDRNSAALAEALNSASTAMHGYSPCPPYSDNFISTMHLTGGSSQPEFDQFGWWFWLGSGDVQFRLELKTTAFDHVDIPLTPAECDVVLAPGVSATPGEVLDRGVLRLNRNHFDLREPDFASIEFTVTPTSHACLIKGDARPLAIRVGMPALIH